MAISVIQSIFKNEPELELAILVGSQADGRAHSESDWDIAIQWNRDISFLENLGNTETLRRKLAKALGLEQNKVDLIDLPQAGLAMKALVAEEGIPLEGKESLAWSYFLLRVWGELEDYEWSKQHAV